MGKTANLELNTTEMSDKISDFVGEYNSNMNMLDDLYGDVQDDASSALSTAQSAETKATAAQTAATNAVTTANSANTTAQSAVSTANSANTTAGQANTKADNAVATANTAKTTADAAKETAETASADVADKADVDGTYDSFTAGGAKQLLSTVYVDDNEPYNFRTAGGSADIGDRMYEEVVGGSIVWNQLARITDNLTRNGITITRVSDTSVSVTGTTTAHCYLSFSPLAKSIENHVYIALLDLSDSDYYSQSKVILYNDSKGITTDNKPNGRTVGKATADSNFYIRFYNGVTFDNLIVGFQVFDLTTMFGSTIADYIYSLEQGTAGAGVAWFRILFPKPYYEYNAGELMSVKAGSHDTVGFNQFDESVLDNLSGVTKVANGWSANQTNWFNSTNTSNWSNVHYLENTVYCCAVNITIPSSINAMFLRVHYTDGTYASLASTPGGQTTTLMLTSNGSKTVDRFNLVYTSGSGTAIVHSWNENIAWDGERNGQYEPYEFHEYPLDELELRGIPKLDANNQLYYDGDTYASDGTVTRKYGTFIIGSNTAGHWAKSSSFAGGYYYTEWAADNSVAGSHLHIQDKGFTTVISQSAYSSTTNCVYFDRSLNVKVDNDTYPTVSDFEAFISANPITMVYVLKTPTTETADTYANPQVVDDFGTEEYTDFAVEAGDRDVAIPVGHNSKYMNNLRAKLEMAPESPSGDGKYILQQSNGENAYIPYTADGRLDAIEAKLPAPPSANGTYKLTATVSNNGVTYSWQS